MSKEKFITIPDKNQKREKVLAVQLTYRGFGFTVFEDQNTILDWGHASVDSHDPEIFKKRLIAFIEYDQIKTVLSYSGYKRPVQIQKNIASLEQICKSQAVKCKIISKEEVHSLFESLGSHTKYQRARLIASYIPDLAHKLPPPRKPWMSEDLRMSIFDSACLALTYFLMNNKFCSILEENQK